MTDNPQEAEHVGGGEHRDSVTRSTLPRLEVPSASEFTDRGRAFAPSPGQWDTRLAAGTPGTIIQRGSTFYAFYVGAAGDRPSDDGPARRAVGVVTSTDGITWTKHAENPVIPWADLNRNGDVEEGAWRLAVTEDRDGTMLMYVTVLEGSGGSVAGPIHLFTSSDGIAWTDQGRVIDPEDASFPGNDEFGVLGATLDDDTYYLIYTAKGTETYSYSATSATTNDGFTAGEVLWDPSDDVRYGSNPIQISDTEWLHVAAQFNGDINLYRTTSLESLGSRADTWDGNILSSSEEAGNVALYLDRDAGTWILLLANALNRSDDNWSEVRIFTAPVTLAD